jgi:hypothetical protein
MKLISMDFELLKIKSRSFREVELPLRRRLIRVEVRSSSVIDCGIMNDSNYRRFLEADSDQGIRKAVWYEEEKAVSFTFDVGKYPDHWLILFNAYSDDPVFAAYAIVGD